MVEVTLSLPHLGVMLLGDTHGNQKHLFKALDVARHHGKKKIIQLGDFGFFWAGCDYTKPLSEMLERLDMEMDFLEGNHEDYNLLGGLRDCAGPLQLRPRIRYLPRGCVWMENGTKIMALGGATSVDAYSRTPGITWFEEERIDESDVGRAKANGPVDVLLTHDAPPTPMLEKRLAKSAQFWPADLLEISAINRNAIRTVVDAVRPKLIVHGHYHFRYQTYYQGPDFKSVVIGLAHDNAGDASWLNI